MLRKSYTLILIIVLLSTFFVLNISAADAAEKPDIGDVVKETGAGIEAEKEKSDIPTIEEKPIKEPLKILDGKKVLVKKIKIEGNSAISADKLEALVNTE